MNLSAQSVEEILRNCGAMLMECLERGKTNGEWSGEQFKAEADDLAHNFLASSLSKAFPGVPIVSEEDAASIAVCAGDHFIIDPIDGTASFAHGFAGWVTQAAYIRGGRPVMAGIYAPASDEYFSAISSNGAYCNGHKLCIPTSSDRAATLIDNYPEPRGVALEIMQALQISTYLESGSIALKICRVADGTADLFVKNMIPRDWDIAAPMLVLSEAGGVITDIKAAPIVLGRKERSHQGLIAACSPAVAEQVRTWFCSTN